MVQALGWEAKDKRPKCHLCNGILEPLSVFGICGQCLQVGRWLGTVKDVIISL